MADLMSEPTINELLETLDGLYDTVEGEFGKASETEERRYKAIRAILEQREGIPQLTVLIDGDATAFSIKELEDVKLEAIRAFVERCAAAFPDVDTGETECDSWPFVSAMQLQLFLLEEQVRGMMEKENQ